MKSWLLLLQKIKRRLSEGLSERVKLPGRDPSKQDKVLLEEKGLLSEDGRGLRPQAKGSDLGPQVSPCVLLSGILVWGKVWDSCQPPTFPIREAFPGPLRPCHSSHGSGVKSGFPGPQPLSSVFLIKPESRLGPQSRIKVLGSTSVSGEKTEMEEGSRGQGCISGLNCPYNGLGAASWRGVALKTGWPWG